jgi:hypothetical protein
MYYYNSIMSFTRKRKIKRKNNGSKTRRQFLYNPNNPKKSFNVYINKNPKDTIPIKYKTVEDVKDTISRLESLYKNKQYPHKRIWQVGMIMKVRLEVLKDMKPRQYRLADRYFKFLGKRTQMNEKERFRTSFIY